MRRLNVFGSIVGTLALVGVFATEVVAGAISVVIGSIAHVQASTEDSQSVQGFLKEYESTLASGRVEYIVQLYQGGRSDKAGVLRDYFENVIQDLEVRLDDVDIRVEDDSATVSFKRTDSFTDRATGDPIRKSVKLERKLVREARSWQIAL